MPPLAYSIPAAPAARTTLPQRSISDLHERRKLFRRAAVGRHEAALVELGRDVGLLDDGIDLAQLSRSTIGFGVPPGATNMCHDAASKPGRPASASGGKLRRHRHARRRGDAERAELALARQLHATRDGSTNISETWPATTSLSAGALPL